MQLCVTAALISDKEVTALLTSIELRVFDKFVKRNLKDEVYCKSNGHIISAQGCWIQAAGLGLLVFRSLEEYPFLAERQLMLPNHAKLSLQI